LTKIKGKSSGKVSESKTKKEAQIIKGKFIGNEVGFGFVVPESPEAEDIFIPPNLTWGALHGDEVACRLIPNKPMEMPAPKKKGSRTPKAQRQQAQISPDKTQRQTGEIIEITHRKPLFGTFYTIGPEGYIRPMEKKIPHAFSVSPKSRNRFGLVEGYRVVFNTPKPKKVADTKGSSKTRGESRISSGHYTLPCQVTEVLGHIHDPGVDVLTLVRQHNIPYKFPEEVLAAEITDEMNPADIEGRLDLRDLHIITIDGEDTKDIDDAVHLTKTPDGHWQLGVHIADVSHYVEEDTPIDREALNRGTSVYLADRVIPMLPHKLSSGICSLFPGVDRLTISCIMTVDERGNVISYEIVPSVINSKRRWAYTEVQELLDGEPSLDEGGGSLGQARDSGERCFAQALFANMNQLREILCQKRRAKGALDFDLPEAKIRVDEEGHPISIEPYKRSQATGIIEEFMILCNETIAAHALNHSIPLIYRAHEAPTPEKLARLKGIAESFGYNLPYAPGPMALQLLLETAEKSPAYYSIAMATLTSLPQAIYTPENPKHYGLASEAYCHFTSPIRRYADLQVHRIIKAMIQLKKGSETAPPIQDTSLEYVSAQCSRTEREAEALEREVAQLKKAQFMRGKEGRQFEGIVSGITPWGVYVMLENTVEGLLPSPYLKKLGYSHNKDMNRYANKHTRTSLGMGTPLNVRLLGVDEDERRISFALTPQSPTS